MKFQAAKRHLFKIKPKACETCGSTVGVQVHHIDCNPKNNDIKNLKILCHFHHSMTHDEIGWRRNDPLKRYPKRLVVEIEKDFYLRCKHKAALNGQSLNAILIELLKGWVSNSEVPNVKPIKLGTRGSAAKKANKA